LKSFIATLLDVYPHVRAYLVDVDVLFFLASNSEIEPEAQILATGEPLRSHPNEFKRKGIGSVNDLVAALAWDIDGLRLLAVDAPLITDNDNRMAMQSMRAFEERALPYARLQKLIGQYGILYDPLSEIHQQMASAIDFAYIVDRLELMHARDLLKSLAKALQANHNPAASLLEAKMLKKENPGAQTDQLLLSALDADPDYLAASYLLLKNRAAAIRDESLPERYRPYVDNLTNVAYAVIQSMDSAQRRDLRQAQLDDHLLEQAKPYEQWYLDAAKLRADWRITATARGETSGYATEAVSIIDEVIALRQDINFYGMRMAAAFLANDHDAVVETARRMVWLVRQEFEFRSATPEREISARELSNHLVRLKSMQAGLSAVRKSGRIADYKFVALDGSIAELREKFEAYAVE